jgi:hypothetical protein
MNDEQLAALYGPGAHFSDNRPGDTITFRDSRGQEVTDTIVWICAPVAPRPGRAAQPITYIMTKLDEQSGMPYMVYPSEILATPAEPTLYQCSCGAMHNAGQRCPLA